MKVKVLDCELKIIETKQETVNGVPIGIVKGLASTFGNVDSDGDVIVKGAFIETIKDHQLKNRQVRMLYQHDRRKLIGGFPPELIKETEAGLEVVGHINLETTFGKDAFALAKQGVLVDFSIGFTVESFDDLERTEINGEVVTLIKKILLREISLVDIPANEMAQITEVKASRPAKNLPLADDDYAWDSSAAVKRFREFTESNEQPSQRYRAGFMWYDQENASEFGSYKLPFVDIINGEMRAVPRALIAIKQVLSGARGGVNIPEEDLPSVKRNVNTYLKRIDIEPVKTIITVDDLKGHKSKKELEKILRESGVFSKDASILLVSCISNQSESDELEDVLAEIQTISDEIDQKSLLNLINSELFGVNK